MVRQKQAGPYTWGPYCFQNALTNRSVPETVPGMGESLTQLPTDMAHLSLNQNHKPGVVDNIAALSFRMLDPNPLNPMPVFRSSTKLQEHWIQDWLCGSGQPGAEDDWSFIGETTTTYCCALVIHEREASTKGPGGYS